MALKEIYNNCCRGAFVSIMLCCLLFSCKTKNEEQEERERSSYELTNFTVSIARMSLDDIDKEIMALAESIEKNPLIKIDTWKLDSLVDNNLRENEYHKRFTDSLAALKKDEKGAGYFDKATAVYAALDSFYNKDFPVFNEIIRSNSVDRVEQLFEFYGSSFNKINRAFTEWHKSTKTLSEKYPMSKVVKENVEQWNLNKTVGGNK